MATNEKTKDKIAKPVYFNVTNNKEKEIVDWIESKFSSFGGLVKDLLYKEMIQEKNGMQPIEVINAPETIIESGVASNIVDPSEVKDVDC